MNYMIEKFLIPAGRAILNGASFTALDIGGAYGLQSHWEKFIGNSVFYLFEPHEESYNKLIEQYKYHPYGSNFKPLPFALAEKDGPTKFYATNCPTGSSLLKPNTKWKFHSPNDPYYYPLKEIDIEGVSLKTAMDRAAVPDIDVIKMDIQGAELSVLRGLDKARLDKTLLIELEILFEPFYENSCKLSEVEDFLNAHDMVLYDIRAVRSARKVPAIQDTYNQKVFGVSNQDPSIAQKIGEIDCIYFKNTDILLKNKDLAKLRKMIYTFSVYNFFGDAMLLLDEMLVNGLIDLTEYENTKQIIIQWQRINKEDLKTLEAALAMLDGRNYGQYTWLPYPSS